MEIHTIAEEPVPAKPPLRTLNETCSLDCRQTLALSEWRRLSENGRPPKRTGFRPERIKAALPVSTLLGVDQSGRRISFHHRIEGTMAQIAFGEHDRQPFDYFFAPDHYAQSFPEFHDAVRYGHVTLTNVAASTIQGAPFDFTRLLLPFCGQNDEVTRILVVYGFDTKRLLNLCAPLRMRRTATTTRIRRAERSYLRLKTA